MAKKNLETTFAEPIPDERREIEEREREEDESSVCAVAGMAFGVLALGNAIFGDFGPVKDVNYVTQQAVLYIIGVPMLTAGIISTYNHFKLRKLQKQRCQKKKQFD